MRFCDLTGKRYGRLTVIKRVYKEGDKKTYWMCKCDCGNETVVLASNLKRGHTTSCGCLKIERTKETNSTHGLSRTRIYHIYKNMKDRTTNDHNIGYKNYGGRSIKICDEWLNDFEKFYNWSMENGYKDGLTIDRINVNGNYEPSNCRWVTMKVQSNNRRNNHNITYNGETHTLSQWSERLGINCSTLSDRINRDHWPIERAFTK